MGLLEGTIGSLPAAAAPISLMLSEQTYNDCSMCRESLLNHNIQAYTSPHDGDVFYRELVDKKPDVALLEVFMPGLDALAVKRNFDNNHGGSKTQFFATGPFFSDGIIRELIGNGFGYYFMKPFSPDALGKQIHSLVRAEPQVSKPAATSYHKATWILRDLGMPAHLLGYHYVRQAIGLVLENPDSYGHGMVTRKLYPDIADMNNTSPSRIERGIRHAIEALFDRSQPETIERYFGSTVGSSKGKTTNAEFIMLLVDHIHVMESCPEVLGTVRP